MPGELERSVGWWGRGLKGIEKAKKAQFGMQSMGEEIGS